MRTNGMIFRSTLALIFLWITLHSGLHAQADSTKTRRHELGMDVIGFVRMFPNIGGSLDFWSPNYLITYRYHFKKSNLRMGLGGTGSQDEFKVFQPSQPTERVAGSFFAIDFRIGYEGVSNLHKKWQVLYGVDLRPTFLYSAAEYAISGSGTTYHQELFAHQYGVAPVMGFRFKPTNRISIVLESSIAFNVQFAKIRVYDVTGGAEIESMNSPRTRFYVSYYQPVSLSFTFDL
jgi:hypothetical protein